MIIINERDHDADHNSNHSNVNGNNIMHQPLIGYIITGLCTSVLFFILGVLCTISIQWCQQRRRGCTRSRAVGTNSGHDVSQGGQQQQLSEPVYAECSMVTSPQEFNTNSNIAYRHPQVKNMYIYAY